ncbi:uncharacterized protein [Rutidosis leptorrhynchoides]|uniref:uncharacterized protein n=1 Tax=Rutidosis leptorrhynchoides TaxID=125765 RepID=UPI003A98D571
MGGNLNYRPSLGIWYNIIATGDIVEDLGIRFKNSFVKVIGNGRDTSFWHEVWIGQDKLCDAFPRLYRLETFKHASVSMRVYTRGSSNQFSWAWVHQPMGRSIGELEDLERVISDIKISEDNDSWKWSLDGVKQFTVKKLSGLCDEKMQASGSNLVETLRNNLVPKNIEVFVWRLMKKRLPIRIELDKRGIDLHSVLCPLCDDDCETTDHTVLFCSHAHDIWSRVFSW